MDGEAWWAAVYGVAQSRTRLKQLSSSSSRAMLGEGNGNPLQYCCPENPMGGEAWWAAVHGVVQSRTRLKRLSSSREFRREKAMATHSSTVDQKIPWMEEPGRLQSMGSLRVRHD